MGTGNKILLWADADGLSPPDCLEELGRVCVVARARSEHGLWLHLDRECRDEPVVVVRGKAGVALALCRRIAKRRPGTAVILFGVAVSRRSARAAVLAGVETIVGPGDCGALCSAIAIRLGAGRAPPRPGSGCFGRRVVL